jgi:hypothetical protein
MGPWGWSRAGVARGLRVAAGVAVLGSGGSRRRRVVGASWVGVGCGALVMLLGGGTARGFDATSTSASEVQLQSVSCSSSRACTAVGTLALETDNVVTSGSSFAERWNGSAWSVEQIPAPATLLDPVLSGVSCPSSRACFAVGATWSSPTGSLLGALVARWDGQTWSIQPAPAPSRSELKGISCSSPVACTAVGDDRAGPLAERWNGKRWSIQRLAKTNRTDRLYALTGVSCTSNKNCTAVGSVSNKSVGAEGWNGSRWSLQGILTDEASHGVSLNAVSCSSRTACIAVGDNASDEDIGRAWARWNGSRWTLASDYGAGNGVSCVSASWCEAVGSYNLIQMQQWNGSRWSGNQQFTGTDGGTLRAVSCTSLAACVAVGGAVVPWASTWNGHSWVEMMLPSPTGVPPPA